MRLTQFILPQICQQLVDLSARVMEPQKSQSRKETKAISAALAALKEASAQPEGKVAKPHRRYFKEICDAQGKINPVAIKVIQENLTHYRKDAWRFKPL